MRPIGTVTMYYKFLEDGLRNMIGEVLDESINYNDFVKRLTDRVCRVKSSETAVMMASKHCLEMWDNASLAKIAQRYNHYGLIHPILYFATSYQGGKPNWGKATDAIDTLLESKLAEWIVTEMMLFKFELSVFQYPSVPLDLTLVSDLRHRIEGNPDLRCFLARYHDMLSQVAYIEGNIEEALRQNEQGLILSEEFDDQHRIANLLRSKASFLMDGDRKDFTALLLKSREMFETLGDKLGQANVTYHLSMNEATRGEYDSAIEHTQEVVSTRESLGMPIGIMSYTLSTLYNVIGNGDAGLKWARMAETELEQQPGVLPYAFLSKVWSLALLDSLSEARDLVDTTRVLVLKSGEEPMLELLYFTEGILAMSERNYRDAIASLGKALEISIRLGRKLGLNMCLAKLAEAEVRMGDESSHFGNSDESGSWLGYLEEMATSEELPGVLGEALVLKAELSLRNGDIEKAREYAQEAARLSNQPGLSFLRQFLMNLGEEADLL